MILPLHGVSDFCLRYWLLVALVMANSGTLLLAQTVVNNKFRQSDKFRQLEEILPTPNDYRTASGSPGHEYWQQKVDYDISVELDDVKQRLIGRETITYKNNSPDTLRYLWLQLDANRFHPKSNHTLSSPAPSLSGSVPFRSVESILMAEKFQGATKITEVRNAESNEKLDFAIVSTNMRVDLPAPLQPGQSIRFVVGWEYNINNARVLNGRTGYEYFEVDKNYIYELAQWFPRLCAYTDVTGWQHKEFLGMGEFTLEFGDYVVRITAPDDHVVASTGELSNAGEVLTEVQRQRLDAARTAAAPMFIVDPAEAKANEAAGTDGKKTWIYRAENVRDFAFASSRKFIWDAQGCEIGGKTVLAMSYYPKEGEPLWSKYSTRAIVHTLKVYSKFTFDYPYPIAISVNGPIGGMEYPMICFNGPRPEKDGTYSARTKYALITVIIHEVGHNYFPMIVNTDERQWTWMDEGLNTFLQYLAEVEWEEDYPSQRGEPSKIASYMKSTDQVPIMTNSESILQFGNNAYGKPATALNILRETILGREQFDFAFREYSRRWQFKRPYPADFFRTMEDASGTDLDWFWHGWFYTTDHVDIEITNVQHYVISDGDPEKEKGALKKERDNEPETLSEQRNEELPKLAEEIPDLKDFYNSFDELNVTEEDKKEFEKYLAERTPKEKELLNTKTNFYIVDLKNLGGLVMPVILKLTHGDKTTSELRLPAELWTKNNVDVSKLIVSQKKIVKVELDPHLETADVDRSNNFFPPKMKTSRFKLFKDKKSRNEMQKAGLGNKDPDAAEKKDSEKPVAVESNDSDDE